MKERPRGFLAEDKISSESEIFDYIRELHEYLWGFVRYFIPYANGDLSEWIDLAKNYKDYLKLIDSEEIINKKLQERIEIGL